VGRDSTPGRWSGTEQAPVGVVRRAFDAFASGDMELLLTLLDTDLEFRPVNALGVMGGTGYGRDAFVEWTHALDREGSAFVASPRRLELVADEIVLVTGVVSQVGQVGGRFASAVAWLFRVRDGRILAAFGYTSEGAARRALNDWS
jgi:ketosteroid isomerase-like protein